MRSFFILLLTLILGIIWHVNKSVKRDEELYEKGIITKEEIDKKFKTKTNIFEGLMYISLFILVVILNFS